MPDNPQKDVRTLLTEAIRKRDELNTFIKVLQEMGGAESAEHMTTGGKTPATATPTRPVADPESVVFPGMFFGKTQSQAAQVLLEAVKRPVKTPTMVMCFEKGGLKMAGNRPSVNLWKTLDRNKDTFVLVPKAGWGLVAWYDPNALARMRNDEGSEEKETESEK